MMKKKLLFVSITAAAVLSIVSCEKEKTGMAGVEGSAIAFNSYRKQVATRADENLVAFPEGTKYALFALNHKDSESGYAWATEKAFDAFPTEGTEQSNGTIKYTPIAIFPQGEELDFFGLTYGNSEVPVLDQSVATDGSTPTITIRESADHRLADLMHSNEVKQRKASDGTVTMPFEHALAALNFHLAKQDETGDSEAEKQLERVKLTEIRLDNVAGQATMNLVTGTWTWEAADVVSRPIYDNADGLALTTVPYELDEKDILIVPNDDYDDSNNLYDESNPYKYRTASDDASLCKGEQVIVTIKLEGLEEYKPGEGFVPLNKTLVDGTVVTYGKCEVSYPVRLYDENTGEDMGPLHFLRNHRYTLSIFVMRDNVRIVAVSPQVYEWEDVDLSQSFGTLGQPVTFGEVVWMDRNLGATTADCENDWLHSLGYWWEYARNIPFIMDIDAFEREGLLIDSRNYLCDKDGSLLRATPGADPAWPYGFLYTYDNHGKRVSLFENATAESLKALPENEGKTTREVVAIDPGDEGTYAYLWWSSGSSYWYANGAKTWDDQYWYTIENQPVPKGWRLPNAKDVYSIMPEETLNWYSTSARYNAVGLPTPKSTSGAALTFAGNYKYQFFYGNIQVDPNADPEDNYSAPLRNSDKKTRLYGIKHQGTSKAYRYLIEMHTSNIPNGDYVRFSQFPATAEDIFTSTGSGDTREWNLHKFDWSHPSAYLDFPLQGQLGNGSITLFGREIKIRLQNRNGSGTYCMKLSNDGTGVWNTYRATTCPTRLVRDLADSSSGND